MKQEKSLEQLFKVAREEEVHFSYEILTKQFKQSTSTTAAIKQLLSKAIHMNTLLIIITGSFLGLLWYSSPTPSSDTSEPIRTLSEEINSSKLPSLNLENEVKQTNLSNKISKNPYLTSSSKASSVEETEASLSLMDSISSAFDSSTTLDIAPTFILEKIEPQQPITVASEGELIPKQLKRPTISYQSVVIDWQDNSKQILKIKQAIKDIGFEVKKLNTDRKKKDIYGIFLHLTHPKGLDWKFTVTDFKQIELKIIKDDQTGLRAFTYRFNKQGSFSPLIYLTEKSVSKHRVTSGTKGRHITRKKKQD